MTVRDLIDARELTSNLTIRDLKVRYKGSVLGFFWSLLNPLLLSIVFTLVFRYILNIQAPNSPEGRSSFPVYLLCALLPWNLLINSLGAGVVSITGSGNLVRKVFFPRASLPLSVVLANGVSFLLELLVLFAFLGGFGFHFWRVLYLLPVLVLLWAAFVLGLSMMMAAFNVYFRDTQQLLAIITLAWFYLTPIIYPIELAKVHLHGALFTAYQANPATAFVGAFRKVLYFGQIPSLGLFGYMLAVSAATLLLGWWTFNRLEPKFAEEV